MSEKIVREIIVWVGLLMALVAVGCTTQPKVTKVLYEDRSAWIRLEVNPEADRKTPAGPADTTLVPSSSALASLLKGFQAEKDYNPGVISFAIGKKYYNATFVEAELAVLAPQLATGLALASPGERVAYCLTADWTADERFITTGWVYIKKPYLYFRLEEWRTPIRVKSPAVPTSEACLIKPIPGYKTSDRFFQLDYSPKTLIVTHGPLGRSIYNGAGEVMFKLAGLDLAQLPGTGGQGSGAVTAPNTSEATGQPQPAVAPALQPALPKEVSSKPLTRAKPLGNAPAAGR